MRCSRTASGTGRPRRGRRRPSPWRRPCAAWPGTSRTRRVRPASGGRPQARRNASVEPLRGVVAGLAHQPRGERLGASAGELRVQQHERLQRHRRRRALAAGGHDRGRVEQLEERDHLRAALLEVDRSLVGAVGLSRQSRPTPSRGALARNVWPAGARSSSPEMASIASRIGFGIEPAQREARQQAVVRIDGVEPSRAARCVWRYTADVRMSRCIALTLQPRTDELRGEVVEQFGVRRLRPGNAEVVGRGDDAGAEVVLPDAVDHDAGEERVLRRRDPVRERGAAARGDAARWPRLDAIACSSACRAQPARRARTSSPGWSCWPRFSR